MLAGKLYAMGLYTSTISYFSLSGGKKQHMSITSMSKKNKPWGGCLSILWFLKSITPSVVYFEPSAPRSSLLSEGWIYIKNVILRVFHMTRKLPLIMIKRNYSTQFKIFCYSLQFCFTSYTKCRYIVKHRIPQDEPKPHETSQNHPLLQRISNTL